ncbi:MAG: hypothetical protein MJZ32_07950 [Bacteroidaceae bacterium]|nr:hypothetical protein [Bacteroidaceae bacterium]
MQKYLLTLMSMIMASTLTVKAQSWCEDLVKLNPDVIDSVCLLKDENIVEPDLVSYMIHYHQPLKHDAPELGSLSLRAFFTVSNGTRGGEFTEKMIQMSIGGYALSDNAMHTPNNYVAELTLDTSLGEIAANYFGHLLMPEHRYFGYSFPDGGYRYKTVGYCEAKEAAADFHALAEAMKKVFHGKWCISGVSKGGIAAAAQHAYYPDDADFFVPYVPPFLNSTNDMRVQEHWMSEPWTPEMREHILHIQKEILHRPAVYEYYHKQEFEKEGLTEDLFRCMFLYKLAMYFTGKYMEETRSQVSQDIDSNMEYLKDKGLEDYSDVMLIYMFMCKGQISLSNGFEYWYENTYKGKSESNKSPQASAAIGKSESEPVFGLNLGDWKSGTDIAFAYQTVHELGYYGLKWDYFYDTQAEKDSVNALWKNNVKSAIDLDTYDVLKNVEYDPTFINFVRQQTKKATKPMIFIYGGDDIWTGAQIEDEYINGDNVRKYILQEQNHSACYSKTFDKDQDNSMGREIWEFLNSVFRPDLAGITETTDNKPQTTGIYNLSGCRIPQLQKGINIVKMSNGTTKKVRVK